MDYYGRFFLLSLTQIIHKGTKMKRFYLPCWKKQYQASAGTIYACSVTDNTSERVCEEVGVYFGFSVNLGGDSSPISAHRKSS